MQKDHLVGGDGGGVQAYCSCCGSIRASTFRRCVEHITERPFQDLCCDECNFVIATLAGHDLLADPHLLTALRWYAQVGEIKSPDGLVTIADGGAVARKAIAKAEGRPA